MNIVSIIIPNYNGGDLLYNCINSIYKNISIKDFEIIVIDNGSTDNSKETLAKLMSAVR